MVFEHDVQTLYVLMGMMDHGPSYLSKNKVFDHDAQKPEVLNLDTLK